MKGGGRGQLCVRHQRSFENLYQFWFFGYKHQNQLPSDVSKKKKNVLKEHEADYRIQGKMKNSSTERQEKRMLKGMRVARRKHHHPPFS